MTGVVCVVFGVVLTFLQSFARGDVEVSCVFMESCILPCSFKVDADVVIHWNQVKAGDTCVHSYFHNQDQLGLQDQRFRHRTWLFKEQISRGNASLQLTGVQVQDQGRYQCYTSTTREYKESFINLKVDAPVDKINIQQVENRMTCSSEGIYPEPELTWSTSPPSNMSLQNKTTVQQTEQQLYSITSSLTVSAADLLYSCTVSTPTNKRRASLKQLPSISSSDTETTIPCTSSNTPLTGLIWRFNHSQLILNQSEANASSTVSEGWRQQVKNVSAGNLILQNLSSKQQGIYSCELSNANETYVTNTFLRVIKDSSNNDAVIAGGIAGGVIGAIVILAAIGLAAIGGLAFYIHKKYCGSATQTGSTRARQQANGQNIELHELDSLTGGAENGRIKMEARTDPQLR